MTKSVKIALAFLATAGVAGSVASAADSEARRGDGRLRDGMRMERFDSDSSGDITFDEFAAAMQGRIGEADADKDGKMTVGEIAAAIERMRAERMATRMIERFDADGDGMLTMAEIEDRRKKRFALLDRNGDGKIAEEELPRHFFGRRGNRRF